MPASVPTPPAPASVPLDRVDKVLGLGERRAVALETGNSLLPPAHAGAPRLALQHRYAYSNVDRPLPPVTPQGFPCCHDPPAHASAATTPVESSGASFARFPNDRSLPRLWPGRLPDQPFRGLHSVRFRCSLRARQVTKSDPLHRRLRPFRFLHDRSDCYRLERKLPGGSNPLKDRAFSRRTTVMAHPI